MLGYTIGLLNKRYGLVAVPRVTLSSFENSPRHDSYVPRYEAELSHYCEKLVLDLHSKKVKRGRERAEPAPAHPMSAEKSEQLCVLEEKIKNLLEQMESLGEAGKVDEAEALMLKVDILNTEKTTLTQRCYILAMMSQAKKMELCEICGSLLIANDATDRTQSHMTGKQHIGYGMLRDFISEFKEAKEKAREEGRLAREREAEEWRKKRERENEVKSWRGDFSDRRRDWAGGNRDIRRDWAGGREYQRNSGGYVNGRDGGREYQRNRGGYADGRDGEREYQRNRGGYVNGRDGGRAMHYGRYSRHECERSRSGSPIGHSPGHYQQY